MPAIELETIKFPELVIGLAGPIGVDSAELEAATTAALASVGYEAVRIKITDEMYLWTRDAPPPEKSPYLDRMKEKIRYANQLREKQTDEAFLAKIAIRAIRRERASISGSATGLTEKRTAYIVSQLKRPEEVAAFRQVYGKQFVLISAYGSEINREEQIYRRIKSSSASHLGDREAEALAKDIIDIDAEESAFYGQRLRKTFHLADAFVDGVRRSEMEKNVQRFIDALFGRTDLSPNKEEYGMYAAKSASLRSADLSRQVGAAIFSPCGEIITLGCNEVPKAHGGTYWDSEEPDFRDVMLGTDPNENLRDDIIKDFLERLKKSGHLSRKTVQLGNASQIADALTQKARIKDGQEIAEGPLAAAMIMDLTEYGRIVHAEMCAVCDAARLGKSVKGAILYCTTFPCHNCTKHILASGISKVIYIEPYPKSKAEELHRNEISVESEVPDRVSFMPFLGISPLRYRDIFQKGRRKGSGGAAKKWLSGVPRPMIEIIAPTYIDLEAMALGATLGAMVPTGDPADSAA